MSEWLFGDGVRGHAPRALRARSGTRPSSPALTKHVLCIAGGSGIAGMMSILARACEAGHFAAWDGHVFFGVRTERDALLPGRAGGVPGARPGAARGHDRALGRGRAGVAARRLSRPRVRARLRPRGGGRAHEGPVRRRPRLRGGPAARWSTRACVCCCARRGYRPPTSGTTSSARARKERRWASTSSTCSCARAARPARTQGDIEKFVKILRERREAGGPAAATSASTRPAASRSAGTAR